MGKDGVKNRTCMLGVGMYHGTSSLGNSMTDPEMVKQSYSTTQKLYPSSTTRRHENICSHKNVYMNTYNSVIQNNQKVQITQYSPAD